ncbi:MAG: hypothetical protein CL710_05535 [Chloroflexi bacterium]|nr:hypothetical protein [Chloroflexota bacterium]
MDNAMSTAMDIRKKFFSQIKKAYINDDFALISNFIIEQRASMWLVGGQIRDYYLRISEPATDIDLATDCDVRKLFIFLKTNFPLEHIKFFKTYHTVSLTIHDVKIDIAQLRAEEYSRNSLSPKITFVYNIIDDLQRRDFTMNSIAINLLDQSINDIFDPFNGIKAINEKSLRAIHKQSYINDPTRIFRAAKYMSRLNLLTSFNEEMMLKEAVHNISALSKYSIDKEIQLIQEDKNPSAAIQLLNSWGYYLKR